MQAATYAVANNDLPNELNVCKNSNSDNPPSREVTVQASTGSIVSSSTISAQCGTDSICIIPLEVEWLVDNSVNLGALIVRGNVEWNDNTQLKPDVFICAGYIALEGQGNWNMNLQVNNAFIYIKDNGAVHSKLRSRAFGTSAFTDRDYPVIDMNGRELVRTWSLLSIPLQKGDTKIKLMHNAYFMGW